MLVTNGNRAPGEGARAFGRRLLGRGRVGRGRGGEGPADSSREPTQVGRGSLASIVLPVGRVALWVFICLVLVRGLGDMLAEPDASRAPVASGRAGGWPDDRARAFAVAFAHTYLTWRPVEAESRRRRLAGLTVPELRDRIAGELPRHGEGGSIAHATIAATKRLSADRALVTVACMLADGTRRDLLVPVARDDGGGIAVFALPSFGSAPPLAQVNADQSESLPGADVRELSRLSGTFLAAYLSRDVEQLSYLVAAGARVDPPSDLGLVEVVQIGQVGSGDGRRRRLVVEARVRDRGSGAVYPATFWIDVTRRDRWYVSQIAGGGGER